MIVRVYLERAYNRCQIRKFDATDLDEWADDSKGKSSGKGRRTLNKISVIESPKGRSSLPIVGELLATHPLHPKPKVFLHVDFHDQGLDVDHHPRDIQFLDDLLQDKIVVLVRRDHQ